MSTPTAVAERLYRAFADTDATALLGLLTADFVGTVSSGMPHGVGGTHRGPAAMVANVWGRIAAIYDIHVDADRYLAVDDTHVVVVGRYRGSARAADGLVDAAFAHIITTRGDRVAALQQITDTRCWAMITPDQPGSAAPLQ